MEDNTSPHVIGLYNLTPMEQTRVAEMLKAVQRTTSKKLNTVMPHITTDLFNDCWDL